MVSDKQGISRIGIIWEILRNEVLTPRLTESESLTVRHNGLLLYVTDIIRVMNKLFSTFEHQTNLLQITLAIMESEVLIVLLFIL